MRLHPGVRYLVLQKGKASVTNFFYHYVKEIRLSLSLEDSYRAEGGVCSDFIGRKPNFLPFRKQVPNLGKKIRRSPMCQVLQISQS